MSTATAYDTLPQRSPVASPFPWPNNLHRCFPHARRAEHVSGRADSDIAARGPGWGRTILPDPVGDPPRRGTGARYRASSLWGRARQQAWTVFLGVGPGSGSWCELHSTCATAKASWCRPRCMRVMTCGLRSPRGWPSMTRHADGRRTRSPMTYSVTWGPGCSCGVPGSRSISTDGVTPRCTSARRTPGF